MSGCNFCDYSFSDCVHCINASASPLLTRDTCVVGGVGDHALTVTPQAARVEGPSTAPAADGEAVLRDGRIADCAGARNDGLGTT